MGTGLEPPAQDESEMDERYLLFDKTFGLWKDRQAHLWRFTGNKAHKVRRIAFSAYFQLPDRPKFVAILALAVAKDYPITYDPGPEYARQLLA